MGYGVMVTLQILVLSFLVTHDQEEALEVSDEIVVMNHGKIEQTGSAEAIYRKPDFFQPAWKPCMASKFSRLM